MQHQKARNASLSRSYSDDAPNSNFTIEDRSNNAQTFEFSNIVQLEHNDRNFEEFTSFKRNLPFLVRNLVSTSTTQSATELFYRERRKAGEMDIFSYLARMVFTRRDFGLNSQKKSYKIRWMVWNAWGYRRNEN